MDSLSYLFAALAITWVALFAYVYYLGQRVRELRHDVSALEEDAAAARPDRA